MDTVLDRRTCRRRARRSVGLMDNLNRMALKLDITPAIDDQIKREVSELLPEDTSTDLVIRIAGYVQKKMGIVRLEEKEKYELMMQNPSAYATAKNK